MTQRAGIAFVASLLPAGFLAEQAKALNIGTVVVTNGVHERSYGYIAERVPGLRVVRLPGGRLRSTLALAVRLAGAKIRGRDVFFFHECCWPLFDLLVSTIGPSGVFFPQVTMASFDVVPANEVKDAPSMRRTQGAALRIFADRFIVYRARKNSGEPGFDYFPSYRQYPPSIRVAAVQPRPAVRHIAPASASPVPDVVFIGGTEVGIADADLRAVYRDLISVARAAGCAVFIKDHPLSKLNVEAGPGVVEIDSALPIELVDRRFSLAVGVASTALLSVGDRKVSIVSALDGMPEDVKRMRMKHLRSLPGSEAVEFPPHLDAVRDVFSTLRASAPQ